MWAAGLGLALLIRIMAASDDLWLDEILSIHIAQNLNHFWEVFNAQIALVDNNHILNTLYLFFIGNPEHFITYRWFSIIAGTALVALMGCAVLEKNRLEAATAIGLGIISYPMIQFASEARGYGAAMFFSVACFVLIQAWWKQKKTRWLVLFWCSVILGFLSHLTFAYIYVSICVWSVVHEIRTKQRARTVLVELARYHALPFAFATGLFFLFFQKLCFLGNTLFSAGNVVFDALQLPLASPENGWVGVITARVGFFIIAYGIYLLRKSDKAIFFFCLFLPVPALFIYMGPSHLFNVRYTVLCIGFFYLLLAHILCYLYKKGFSGKILYVLVISLVCYGNIIATTDLIQKGRGRYYEAVCFMANTTEGKNIVVGSDHDFRNKMMLRFYSRFLPKEKRIIYVPTHLLESTIPDWVIMHNFSSEFIPLPVIQDGSGTVYTLAKTFDQGGLAGWRWFIYKKVRKL